MDAWQNAFIGVALLLAFIAAYVPRIIWPVQERPAAAFAISLIASVAIMAVLSVLSAVAVFGVANPEGLVRTISTDPGAALAFFSETGAETAALWTPVTLASSLFCAIKSRKT